MKKLLLGLAFLASMTVFAETSKGHVKACDIATKLPATNQYCIQATRDFDLEPSEIVACGKAVGTPRTFAFCLDRIANFEELTTDDIKFCGEETWTPRGFSICLDNIINL